VKSVLVAHPTANAYVRQTLHALREADILAEFWTGVAYPAHRPWYEPLIPGGLRAQLRRRRFEPNLAPVTHTHPWMEARRLWAARQGRQDLVRHEVGRFSVDNVFRDFDERLVKRLRQPHSIDAVYLGEDFASQTFAEAERQGLRRFYDLPIGYWRAAHEVYREEAELQPAWAATLEGMKDSPAKLARKEEELARAEVVFVASTFTRNTLALAPECNAQVVTAPYGGPPAIREDQLRPRDPREPFRVLFVGSLGQRKGTSYLLDAMDRLGPGFELTLVGRRPAVECPPLDLAVQRHRWIETLPHAGVLEEMARAHVLVFPSLFEGFGLVILEAMSRGLPVITTMQTAGPDVITDGEDGFIVPVRDPDAIANCVQGLAADPPRWEAVRRAALSTANRRTWDLYHRVTRETVGGVGGEGQG